MFRTDDDTGGLNTNFYAMGAVVAFGGRVRVRVDIQRVVRASLGTGFATNTTVIVEIDDPIGSGIKGSNRTDFNTRRVSAVVATVNGEQTAGMRINALLNVLDPRAIHPQRHVMFGFTRYSTGVTANTLTVIDDEAVVHATFSFSPGDSIRCGELPVACGTCGGTSAAKIARAA